MTQFAIIRNNQPEELPKREWWVDDNNITHSFKAFELWTLEELAEKNVYPIQEPEIPEDKQIVSSSLSWDGEVVTRQVTLEDVPTEPSLPTPEPPSLDEVIRRERDYLITQSDWTQLLDSPVDRDAWAIYRQELRDIPQQEGFPGEVEWPTAPWAKPGSMWPSYSEGSEVKHTGLLWVSLYDDNSDEPGIAGWEQKTS